MTLTLHIGVVEIPYTKQTADGAASPKRGKARSKRAGRRRKSKNEGGLSGAATTGEVADILEAKYHVMEHFYQAHGDEIAADLEEGLAGALESVLMGAPLSQEAFAGGETKIDAAFRRFLSSKEIEALGYPGVPTKAALEGVSHRYAHPYAKRSPRPSFIDTGLYETSEKSWVDEGS